MGTRSKLRFVSFLTFVRFPLIVLFFVAAILGSALREGHAAFFGVAFVCLLAAALSDALDGFFARRFNVVTPLGAYADPLMDRLVCLGSLPVLVYVAAAAGQLTHAATLLALTIFVLVRDQWVTFLRSIGTIYGTTYEGIVSNRLRALVNFPVICIAYFAEAAPGRQDGGVLDVAIALEAVAIAVNLVSALEYTIRFWPCVRRAAGGDDSGPLPPTARSRTRPPKRHAACRSWPAESPTT